MPDFSFTDRISKGHGPNDCWFLPVRGHTIWPQNPTYVIIDKKQYKIHRVMYELTYGPLPSGQVPRHRCGNSGCCNPTHMIPGTQRQNILDTFARKRAGIRPGELATYEDLPQN